jgi:hypothetical protein
LATNPFYDHAASASRFVDFDVPTAADLNAPLDEVTAGFDAVDAAIDAIDADLAGLSSPVQTQLDLKADITGETYSGTHNFTGATITAPTPTAGDATTKVATTAFVDAAVVAAATGITVATQAEMEAGTEAGQRIVSPLRVAQAIAAQTDLPREARATNTVFAAADTGKFIEYTGSFTQTFGTAAALGNGWRVILKNAYTDSVYLTPAGGATIDGVTDFLMYPGEARLLQCDGTNFHSVVLQPFCATYLSSGFFFMPPGYRYAGGLAWSGGSSGQRTNNTGTASIGGSGGGCGEFKIPASSFGASETVTIGSGGLAVTTVADGNTGGNTTLGSLFTVFGGPSWGNGGSVGATAALSGVVNGTDFGYGSQNGGYSHHTLWGGAANQTNGGTTGNSLYGGAGGGSVNNVGAIAAPGASKFGGSGGAASIAGNGTTGSVPGGGGGATQTGTASGAGGAGKLVIWGIV